MEQVPQQIGPYRVAEEIGRGRLTVVYRAMDTLYERVVALKVLPVYFAHDPALVRHFVSEGREAMRLQHPGVIQVYDAGQADGFTYLAQEWMSGGTLDEFLATQQGRLPHETVVAIVEQIAAGLDYAHHQGYIHRNLNPRNILFGERGQVKIADFSRGPLPRNTLLSNQLTGSPAFMAPEQARGDENLTAQADIYSLGVVTYLLLAGRLPFEADNPLVLLRKIIEDPPPLVENFNRDVQFGAAYAVHQALTKQPALRQSTAAAFAHALAQGKVTPSLADSAAPNELPPDPALSAAPLPVTPTAIALATPLAPATVATRTKPLISKNQRALALVGGLATTVLVVLFVLALAQSRTTLLDRLLNGSEATSLPIAVFVVQTPSATPALRLDIVQDNVAPAVILASDLLVSDTPVATPAVTPAVPTVVLLAAATESPASLLEQEAPATSAALLATAQSILNRLGSATPTPAIAAIVPIATPVLDPFALQLGLVTDFESEAAWLVDEDPLGTFSTSTEQVYAGMFAGKFDYAFPANAFNNRNYLAVWRTLPLVSDQPERDPNALTLWVYGDGSGSFLNAWITDAAGQDWQFTFGQINHIGWTQMTAGFDLSSGWPNQALGANTGVNPIIYPVNLSALVLDGYPDDVEHNGVVYVDDLAATTLATTSPTPNEMAAVSEAAPAASAPLAAPSSPSGRIAYAAADPHSTRFDLYFYNLESKVSWPKLPGRRQPDFSPQGNLVANSEEGDLNNLILMGPLGEDPRVISAHPEDGRSHWAITGKTLVFESTYEGDRRQRLYLQQDTNYGATVSPLRYDAWEIFGRYPVFLNDGRIAYNGCDIWENGSVCGVYLVDTSGGKPVGVTDWPGDLPSDNLGSQVLVTSSRGGNWDVYLVNPASGAVLRLTDSPAHDGLATASPDGNYVAFVSDRDGAWGVYTMRTDGSEQQKLFEIEFGYGSGDHDWLEERLSWGR